MKVVKSSLVNPFGGINFVFDEFDRLGIGNILEQELPALANQSRYDWRDLLYSFWAIFFCGGDCIEDLSINLKQYLSIHPNLKLPSPDRLLNRMKDLTLPSVDLDAPKGKHLHHFSIHNHLNRLNLKLMKNQLTHKSSPMILDYDNTMLFTAKADAQMTYKKSTGYVPGVGIIDGKVVYVENRNGNSSARVLQHQTLVRMFKLLEQEGLKVDVFRADGASYQLFCLETVIKHANRFFIRARMNDQLQKAINQIKEWEKIELDGQTMWRGSTWFIPFQPISKRKKHDLLRPCRLVVTKEKRLDGQVNLFTQEAYNYHPIITNDAQMSDHEVFHFYNQRGGVEKEFDILKNDFGWNHMPFSKLEQNTVYLILTAICRNLYAVIIKSFSEKYKNLAPHFRIKKFIFRFICTPAKWIRQARSWKLRLYVIDT